MKKFSIIIPVYNNFELTLKCLHCKDNNYEIIISNDCSKDETQDLFKSIDDIIYTRNPENRGFAYTCNRGAELSNGEYLIFLNNDTLIIDNFLTGFENINEKRFFNCKIL